VTKTSSRLVKRKRMNQGEYLTEQRKREKGKEPLADKTILALVKEARE